MMSADSGRLTRESSPEAQTKFRIKNFELQNSLNGRNVLVFILLDLDAHDIHE